MNRLGEAAERRAAEFLCGQGLILVERNYRCRFGEIDLILRDGKTLVFAEVRMRRNRDFGGAAESITTAKQQKLLRAARHYLGGGDLPCRFDAVLFTGSEIDWIKNAFGE